MKTDKYICGDCGKRLSSYKSLWRHKNNKKKVCKSTDRSEKQFETRDIPKTYCPPASKKLFENSQRSLVKDIINGRYNNNNVQRGSGLNDNKSENFRTMERIVNGRTKPIQDKTIKGKRTKEEIMGGDSDDDDEEEHYHPTKRQRQRIEVEEPGSPIKEASSDDDLM